MRILLAATVTATLVACAPTGGKDAARGGNSPPTNAAWEAAEGQKFRMASLIGIGDIVIGESVLTTSDGQQIPIRKITDGLYAFPDPPSALTNGQNFCFSRPVTGFTWHLHKDGVWVMNVGDWGEAPAVPNAETYEAEGACGLSTYRPAGA